MLRWTTALHVMGLVAALLGFAGLTIVTAGLARILIVLFLAGFLVSLIALGVGVLRADPADADEDAPTLTATPLSAGTSATSE